MMPLDSDRQLLDLVATNVALLVEAVYGSSAGKGIAQIHKAGPLPRSTVGRVVTPDGHAWSVTTLGGLARALKVQPWQLLLPDLKAEGGTITSLQGLRARQWPFPTLRREELEDLSPLEIDRLERTMRARIQELREDRIAASLSGKPGGTPSALPPSSASQM